MQDISHDGMCVTVCVFIICVDILKDIINQAQHT